MREVSHDKVVIDEWAAYEHAVDPGIYGASGEQNHIVYRIMVSCSFTNQEIVSNTQFIPVRLNRVGLSASVVTLQLSFHVRMWIDFEQIGRKWQYGCREGSLSVFMMSVNARY